MKLYVTNTTAAWNQDLNEQTIKLHGRTASKERKTVEIGGFLPRFYARTDEIEELRDSLRGNENVVNVEVGGFEPMFGSHELGEIQVRSYSAIAEVGDMFSETLETDVYLTQKARIDWGLYTGVEVPSTECHYTDVEPCDFEVEPRVVTFDIETDDRGAFPEHGEKRILSLVAHDNYSDETHGFVDIDGREVTDVFPSGKPEGLTALHFDSSERKMLLRFASWFSEISPDYFVGWNSTDFDVPYLVARMEAVDVNPDRLSPDGYTKMSRGNARISGLTCYDLLGAYRDTKPNELRSYKLDYVAEQELGEKKLDHSGESIWEMYEEDCDKLIRYNAKDVTLTKDVNEAAGILDFKQALRHEVGVDLDNTAANNEFIEMMVRRKLHERGVIAPDADYSQADSDYEGSFVFDAYSGVTSNVVGIDLASLYPYTMAMANASPESKLESTDGVENYVSAPNGVYFDLSEDGVFKELIEDAISLKSDYKKKRNSFAAGTPEHAEWSEKYAAAKTVTNSVYGTVGWSKFFLYDEEVAEAVTLLGQAAIKRTAEYINDETNGEVIYGDTDSCYLTLPDEWDKEKCLEEAREITKTLNDSIYPSLAEKFGIPAEDCLWEIEVESYMERYYQAGKKKRYAYIATWMDGKDCEPKLKITGFDCQRSDTPMLTKQLQETVIKMILNGATDEKIGEVVHEAATSITPDDPDWDAIGIPGGIGKELKDYAWTNGTPKGAQPRGAFFANEIMGTNFGADDKPKRVYLHPYTPAIDGWEHGAVDVICFDDGGELPEGIAVDQQRMTRTLVTKPMRRILDAVDIDVEAAQRNQMQKGLGAFC